MDDPDVFWGGSARSMLKWFRDFEHVSQGGFEHGDVAWFTGGQLNACYNCVDQHLPHRAEQVFHPEDGQPPIRLCIRFVFDLKQQRLSGGAQEKFQCLVWMKDKCVGGCALGNCDESLACMCFLTIVVVS